jgi:hypothetical protein
MHQYATLEDTVYFWFAANDTSGSGGDGASPVFDVREGGDSGGASAIPTHSASATLLTHANYASGCHEVAVPATAANGFAAGNTYGVFCTLLVDSQNPSGFVGSFTLGPVVSDMTTIHGTALTETPGQLAGRFVDFFGFSTSSALSTHDTDIKALEPLGTAMRGTDSAALAATALSNATWTDARAGYLDELGSANLPSDIDNILADTGELQSNQGNWLTATSVTVSDKTGFSLVSTGLDLVTAWTTDITGTVSGNSTHDAAAVKTAIEAAGSHLALILEDTGTTIPAAITLAHSTTDALITTVDGIVDNILVDTGTTLPATLGTPADTDLATDLANIETSIAAVPTATEIWQLASAIDGKTPQQAMRYIAAAAAGKITTAGEATEIFVGLDGTTSRISVVVDEDGNRSSITYDP